VSFARLLLNDSSTAPSLKKDKGRHRYKHTIEPAVAYRYITGVHRFAEFIHFDSDATLTNTSEVEYGKHNGCSAKTVTTSLKNSFPGASSKSTT